MYPRLPPGARTPRSPALARELTSTSPFRGRCRPLKASFRSGTALPCSLVAVWGRWGYPSSWCCCSWRCCCGRSSGLRRLWGRCRQWSRSASSCRGLCRVDIARSEDKLQSSLSVGSMAAEGEPFQVGSPSFSGLAVPHFCGGFGFG
ncbi:unnamed protein product, partial [Ectocarpus sp. 12 AP-2014]